MGSEWVRLLAPALSLCLAAVPVPAAAEPTPAMEFAPTLTSEVARRGAAGDHALRAYWTPERMRAAESGPDDPASPTLLGVPQAFAMSGPYTTVPNSIIGKVFFTRPDGVDSSCGGSVVTAPNRSLVLTAAHCIVPNSRQGPMNANVVFVPAAHRGTAPWALM